MNERLLETVADIAYIFGEKGYFSGDSRADIQEIIFLAKKFENTDHDWDKDDYLIQINKFSYFKIEELRSFNGC